VCIVARMLAQRRHFVKQQTCTASERPVLHPATPTGGGRCSSKGGQLLLQAGAVPLQLQAAVDGRR